ncbi:hypothetical protein TEA_020050 [Camellia sinensis var. sinensis]|uniref:Uncharacterized protein n=1 Tax=Camellia sinensis var. sinensis TaxID=542762 RepID=A0A4S4DX66_CAMSN|nr:hypothetical protein TEA_020050 [Camellia sinensis var. sinensis]
MRRLVGARDCWSGISKRFRLLQRTPFSTNTKPTIPSNNNNNNNNGSDKIDGSLTNYDETYRHLDKLDFMTAAKILFTTPPKKKKFGSGRCLYSMECNGHFKMVRFPSGAILLCLPAFIGCIFGGSICSTRNEKNGGSKETSFFLSLFIAELVSLIILELELKKKAEEEAKAKEIELNASKEKEAGGSDPELLEVKERINKLEAAVKEIVVKTKKQLDSTGNKNQEDHSEKRHHAATDHNNAPSKSETSNSATNDNYSKKASKNVAPSSSQGSAGGLAAPVTDGVLAKK